MYGKIFESIFDSTLIAEGGWLPTYVFMSMVSIADKDGYVEVAAKVLFYRLGFGGCNNKITFNDFEVAIHYLCQSDPGSKSIDFDGKRIIPIADLEDLEGSRGYWIVNYSRYRDTASREDRAAKSTERSRKFRTKLANKQAKLDSTCNKSMQRNATHGDKQTAKLLNNQATLPIKQAKLGGPNFDKNINPPENTFKNNNETLCNAMQRMQRYTDTDTDTDADANTDADTTALDLDLDLRSAIKIKGGKSKSKDLSSSEFSSNEPGPGALSDKRSTSSANKNNHFLMVFKYWQEKLNHPKSKLDTKRTRAIKNILSLGYSEDDCKLAIDGCSKTPHNMGKNDNGKVYDSISVIFRDADSVDRFMANAKDAVIKTDFNDLGVDDVTRKAIEGAKRIRKARLLREQGECDESGRVVNIIEGELSDE